jgi:molecular chaperone GrpE
MNQGSDPGSKLAAEEAEAAAARPETAAEPIDSRLHMRIWHLAFSCIGGLRRGFIKPNSKAMSETENTMTHPGDPHPGNGDAPDAAPEPASEAANTERLAQIEAERDDFRERWMRSEAEMANLRSRTKREVEDARLYAVQKFARDVVEVAENLKRGLDSLPPRSEGEAEIIGKLRDGFEGIERSFVATLERNGVSTDDPTGKIFDPNLHQAMAEQDSSEHPPGTIIQAWTQAWTLNGRLLRPAMVVVAKAPTGAAAA